MLSPESKSNLKADGSSIVLLDEKGQHHKLICFKLFTIVSYPTFEAYIIVATNVSPVLWQIQYIRTSINCLRLNIISFILY